EIAIENLDDSFKTRASRSAARALLAKVYLTIAGDPELNPDIEQTDGYLAARELCEAIINEGSFSLVPDYLEVFTNERNAEIIWAIDFIPDNLETSQNFSLEWTDDGDRRLNYTTQNIRSVYAARGETVRALFAPSEIVGEFFVTKYLPDGGILEQAGNDWVVLRYADVLLMYVEAVLGGNQATGEPQALTFYNEVRARAGFTTPVTSISKNELLEERRMEFAFENQRFFDLVRFGVAGEVLSAHSEATGGDFVDTDLLLPIPQNEISLSRGLLEQNLGY
ncbi:MAG: RagB/SusD family nutrient uptake outer membrane protein, partial [Cytophagales bacterium]|nr:RagB/SusD family nutrient uptake outer membrane protein [Cytophagales bacterium]